MPIYEFQCKKCGKDFEDLVARRGDKSPCPKCGSKKVERKVSVPAPHVSKGASGFPSCADGTCGLPPPCADGTCSYRQN